MEELCCKIECLRQRMHLTALERGISHPDVLLISCKLDEVLNEFNRISLIKKSERGHRLYLCTPARKNSKDRIFRMGGQVAANA